MAAGGPHTDSVMSVEVRSAAYLWAFLQKLGAYEPALVDIVVHYLGPTTGFVPIHMSSWPGTMLCDEVMYVREHVFIHFLRPLWGVSHYRAGVPPEQGLRIEDYVERPPRRLRRPPPPKITYGRTSGLVSVGATKIDFAYLSCLSHDALYANIRNTMIAHEGAFFDLDTKRVSGMDTEVWAASRPSVQLGTVRPERGVRTLRKLMELHPQPRLYVK
jgi:hypothetical protein